MKTAIDILEQQYKWVKEDRKEAIKYCLDLLKQVEQMREPVRKPKSKEIWEWFVKVMSLQQGGPK